MNILVTAKQAGSAAALVSPIKELQQRGHAVTVYATGSETEAKAFRDVSYTIIHPSPQECHSLVQGIDGVITGLHGFETGDSFFIRAAHQAGIPSFGVLDQNSNYRNRLGDNGENMPAYLAVMDQTCVPKMVQELDGPVCDLAVPRVRVVGWTAFDHYAQMRTSFTKEQRQELLQHLELPDPLYVHFTQNIHPQSKYMDAVHWTEEEKKSVFEYETTIAKAVFEAASDLGKKLVIKPHPGEEYVDNFTKDLVQHHNFLYLPASACNSQQLMLAANSITAGRSTCLTEGCLLDRNTAGILPGERGEKWRSASPAVLLDAIPYTTTWDKVKETIKLVTSSDLLDQESLALHRARFSVDGNAAKRLADLIEEVAGK